MSMAIHSEIERFAKDIITRESLREQLKHVGIDKVAVVDFANSKGYQFSLDDVNRAVESAGEISETQLEHVVGGMAIVLVGDYNAYVIAMFHRSLVWW